jgi:hypothetical protein
MSFNVFLLSILSPIVIGQICLHFAEKFSVEVCCQKRGRKEREKNALIETREEWKKTVACTIKMFRPSYDDRREQGILKGEVSLYH